MSGLNFGVDIDGVLTDNDEAIKRYSKEKYNVTIGTISCWNLADCTDLTPEQAMELFSDPDYYKSMNPKLGAGAFTQALMDRGYLVWLITARKNMHFVTYEWLKDKHIPWNLMIHDDMKEVIAERYNIGTFVEDSYDNALQLAKVCKQVFLIDAGYNQGELPDNVIRVATLEEVLNLI